MIDLKIDDSTTSPSDPVRNTNLKVATPDIIKKGFDPFRNIPFLSVCGYTLGVLL